MATDFASTVSPGDATAIEATIHLKTPKSIASVPHEPTNRVEAHLNAYPLSDIQPPNTQHNDVRTCALLSKEKRGEVVQLQHAHAACRDWSRKSLGCVGMPLSHSSRVGGIAADVVQLGAMPTRPRIIRVQSHFQAWACLRSLWTIDSSNASQTGVLQRRFVRTARSAKDSGRRHTSRRAPRPDVSDSADLLPETRWECRTTSTCPRRKREICTKDTLGRVGMAPITTANRSSQCHRSGISAVSVTPRGPRVPSPRV